MIRFPLVWLLLFFLSFGCGSDKKQKAIDDNTDVVQVQTDEKTTFVDFPVYDFDSLEPLLNKKDDKTYIINFWATWCAPCVAELPYFERTFAEQQEKSSNVEMILVSLDMPSMWESRLVPFVNKKELKGEVVILNDTRMNDWIPKIDSEWDGGIPATLIYNSKKRAFYPHGFTYEELNKELNKFIN